MSERTDKFEKALEKLILDGEKLHLSIQSECHPEAFQDYLKNQFDGDEPKKTKFLESMLPFKDNYQTWYSAAQSVIKQVLPDRLPNFISHYEYSKVRKSVDFENYMIRDYLQGLRVTRYDGQIVASGKDAIPEFIQQLNILKAAKENISSILMDLKGVLQADLFDTEIETAEALSKAGYSRAAGAICGVVIEKHLLSICYNRTVKISKKNPGISDLAQTLRASNIITLAQERFIQSLADTRNICSHAKGREPSKNEIDELVEGTSKVIKTVF